MHLERLAEALHRALGRGETNLPVFPANARAPAPRVVTHARGAIRFFDATTIDRFRASDKYTSFLVDGEEHLTDEPLTALEERLQGFGFVRMHRSELVRIAAVRALTHDAEGHHAQLVNGEVVEISRRMLAAVKEALGVAP